MRGALAELDAVPATLDRGETGWLLPDDLDEVRDPGPWVALLPVPDPTIMGWRGRDFYLGAHRDQTFDSRGNAGTAAWVNGRVVGCWMQDNDSTVRVHRAEHLSPREARALDDEASRMTTWLASDRVGTGYLSPAMKTGVQTRHAPIRSSLGGSGKRSSDSG